MKNENLALYKLSTIKGFGSKTLNIIVNGFKKAKKDLSDIFVLEEKEFKDMFSEFGKGRFKGVTYEALRGVNHELAHNSYSALLEDGIKVITILDKKDYPENVKNVLVDSAPPILYCKGNLSLLNPIFPTMKLGYFQ